MLPSQKKILDVLREKSASPEELAMITGLSPDSIRGRISESRKFGYDIKRLNGKYHLCDDTDVEKVISYVASHNQYGIKIKVNKLIDELDISHEKLTTILSKLYHRKQLFQVTKDTVIIYHL
jgi:biotin operon repressor